MLIITRKKTLEDTLPPEPPIPTQVLTNQEYIPLPKTEKQRQVDYLLNEYADKYGKKRGLSRRAFFKTASGFAAALLAMNKVYGMKFFDVEEVEAADEAAALAKKKPGNQFIFDVQTHYLDAPTLKANYSKALSAKMIVDLLDGFRKSTVKGSGLMDLNRSTYIKEIFLDSETAMCIMSGVPYVPGSPGTLLPIEEMVGTRDEVNAKAGTRRMLSHGLPVPTRGKANLDEMERQVKEFKIDGWKLYPGDGGEGTGYRGWYMDDEKIAYPVWEKAKQQGIKNISVHKGLAALWFSVPHCKVDDVHKAAEDFPDLNFIIYHSGFPWVSDLAYNQGFKPHVTNVYPELGSTFASTVVGAPMTAAHVMGQLITHYGPDRIIWGTDSIWWGSPQWQIDAFRKFRIPDELIAGYGYKQITDEDKTKILGLNAARLYGINVEETMKKLSMDGISRMKKIMNA
jgi:predicted TIM-barrel fold metal-dependent hydrolase